MIKIGIVGLGYWGPNYVRVFREVSGAKVKWCCDLDNTNLAKIKVAYPKIKIVKDFRKMADDSELDAVVIVTSVDRHYELARHFLKKGKHVLVEKPLTSNSLQAQRLIALAKKKKLILMVGHVYLYNNAINALKEIIKNKELGEVYYLKTERLGLGPIRKNASSLWDLATHDISIALYLLEKTPISTFAQGGSYLQKGIEDFVDLDLRFPHNIFCTIYASWLAPEKIRRLTVVGSKGMAVFDDVNKEESLKIYVRRVNRYLLNSTPEFNDHQNIVSIGDIRIPAIKQSEPLKNEAEHFLECILKRKRPISDGQNGLEVIKILEKAQLSLKRGSINANKKC